MKSFALIFMVHIKIYIAQVKITKFAQLVSVKKTTIEPSRTT